MAVPDVEPRDVEFRAHGGDLSRVGDHGVLPARLLGKDFAREQLVVAVVVEGTRIACFVPGDRFAVGHVELHEVHVDRMRIGREVVDRPVLNRVEVRIFRDADVALVPVHQANRGLGTDARVVGPTQRDTTDLLVREGCRVLAGIVDGLHRSEEIHHGAVGCCRHALVVAGFLGGVTPGIALVVGGAMLVDVVPGDAAVVHRARIAARRHAFDGQSQDVDGRYRVVVGAAGVRRFEARGRDRERLRDVVRIRAGHSGTYRELAGGRLARRRHQQADRLARLVLRDREVRVALVQGNAYHRFIAGIELRLERRLDQVGIGRAPVARDQQLLVHDEFHDLAGQLRIGRRVALSETAEGGVGCRVDEADLGAVGQAAEVHDRVCPLGGCHQEGLGGVGRLLRAGLTPVAGERRRLAGLELDDLGQEAAITPDLEDREFVVPAIERCGRGVHAVERGDLGAALLVRSLDQQAHIERSGIGAVQEAEAIQGGCDLQFGPDHAVDDHRVEEGFCIPDGRHHRSAAQVFGVFRRFRSRGGREREVFARVGVLEVADRLVRIEVRISRNGHVALGIGLRTPVVERRQAIHVELQVRVAGLVQGFEERPVPRVEEIAVFQEGAVLDQDRNFPDCPPRTPGEVERRSGLAALRCRSGEHGQRSPVLALLPVASVGLAALEGLAVGTAANQPESRGTRVHVEPCDSEGVVVEPKRRRGLVVSVPEEGVPEISRVGTCDVVEEDALRCEGFADLVVLGVGVGREPPGLRVPVAFRVDVGTVYVSRDRDGPLVGFGISSSAIGAVHPPRRSRSASIGVEEAFLAGIGPVQRLVDGQDVPQVLTPCVADAVRLAGFLIDLDEFVDPFHLHRLVGDRLHREGGVVELRNRKFALSAAGEPRPDRAVRFEAPTGLGNLRAQVGRHGGDRVLLGAVAPHGG